MRWLALSLVLCGCTTYLPPDTPSPSCVVVVRPAYSDTLVVGVYKPPCGGSIGDSVMFWQINAPSECLTVAVMQPGDNAKVIPSCDDPRPYVEVAF